jgi:hypothetical protein
VTGSDAVALAVEIAGVAPLAPFVSASSLGESTGGRVDGVRREEPVQAGRAGRLTMAEKISLKDLFIELRDSRWASQKSRQLARKYVH